MSYVHVWCVCIHEDVSFSPSLYTYLRHTLTVSTTHLGSTIFQYTTNSLSCYNEYPTFKTKLKIVQKNTWNTVQVISVSLQPHLQKKLLYLFKVQSHDERNVGFLPKRFWPVHDHLASGQLPGQLHCSVDLLFFCHSWGGKHSRHGISITWPVTFSARLFGGFNVKLQWVSQKVRLAGASICPFLHEGLWQRVKKTWHIMCALNYAQVCPAS